MIQPFDRCYSHVLALLLIVILALASPLACILECHVFAANARPTLSDNAHFVCPLTSHDHAPAAPSHSAVQALYELLLAVPLALPLLLLAGMLARYRHSACPQQSRAPSVPPPRFA